MFPKREFERDVASGDFNIHMDQPRSINCEDRCNFGIMLIVGQETIRTHIACDDVSCRSLERDEFLPGQSIPSRSKFNDSSTLYLKRINLLKCLLLLATMSMSNTRNALPTTVFFRQKALSPMNRDIEYLEAHVCRTWLLFRSILLSFS